ncbi:MAG: rhamnulokinase [Oscillospiraceae bacterium]|nr:rhamnulokinase [Oscillospiraceae bacterium]
MKNCFLAIDLGASSGRAIIGEFDGSRITLEEIHRFPNDPVRVNGTLYWDVLRLMHEIRQGIRKAKPYQISGIGIDTWGVDFGLLDASGRLLANPVHYRDTRTHGTLKQAEAVLPQDALYDATGNQIMEINTLFQLLAMKQQQPELLANAKQLLLMPDLFAYFLTGRIACDRSIASTTQLYDPRQKDWAVSVADSYGLNRSFLPEIQDCGTLRGMLSAELCEELQMQPVPVYAVCGHDTQSALAAVPAEEAEFAFLSCGTWSLLGTELHAPVLTGEARAAAFTNESAFGNKTAFLKNLTGLWIMQQSLREYEQNGQKFNYNEMLAAAQQAAPFRSLIDTEHPRFAADHGILQGIAAFCSETGQPAPETPGAVFRCITESLALQYRAALEALQSVTKRTYPRLYVIGGGARNPMLMQMTADLCGIPVYACDAEATALGNIAVQIYAAGALQSIGEVRAVCRASQKVTCFEPDLQNRQQGGEIYQKYRAQICGAGKELSC